MYHITFQQVYYFLTLAKTLSFTDTSQILYISQPTLSKQITSLESELGFALFERTKRSVSLTPEGRLLAREWAVIQESINSSIYNAKLLSRKHTGRLQIGCADTFQIDDYLTPAIRAFQEEQAGIDLDLESHGFKTLRRLLYANELDIIFVPEFELPNYKDIGKLNYYKLELGIAVPLSNPLAQKDQVTIADLEHEPIITLSLKESPFGASKVKDYFLKHGITPNIVKQASNLHSLTLALKSGIGCTICHNQIKSSQIRIYTLEDQPYDCNIFAVWKADYASPELDVFKKVLKRFSNP